MTEIATGRATVVRHGRAVTSLHIPVAFCVLKDGDYKNMARIRYIKPEFFTDEDLVALSPVHRLAFAGLWCYADKSGRLEYRPQFLKAMIFPYEQVDMVKIITELSEAKPFLVVYEVSDKKYIQITNWSKHQKPHHTEKESTIPSLTLTEKGMGMENQLGASLELINGELTVKDEKSNKNKKKEQKKFIPPTQKEVIDYFAEKGFPEALAIHVFEYYENGNPPWTDASGKPVLSWKQKMISVWLKPENKNYGSKLAVKNDSVNRGFNPDTCEIVDFDDQT